MKEILGASPYGYFRILVDAFGTRESLSKSVNAQADAQQVWLTDVALGVQPFSRDEAFATSRRSAPATLTSFYGGDMDRFYGYGIVDKDGRPIAMYVDIDPRGGIYRVEHTVSRWNEKTQDSGVPFRSVELFYKDEQS